MTRWIWSELEPYEHEHGEHDLPVAREYATGQWLAPLHFGTHALVRCETNAHHLEASKQDHRVIVLGSIHSQEPIPAEVVEGLKRWGVTPDMTVHQMLATLSLTEPQFEPEN